MSVHKISNTIYSVGVLNPNLRVFDIIMNTDYGTSYNSYIIKAEKTVLIDTCHHSFFDEYIENIMQVVNPAEINYIILNHTEPDHSGALAQLLSLCPNAQIVCSQAASIYLKNITNIPNLSYKVVKDNDTLDIGGKQLKFINAPFLHWPDSMFTWFEDENALFTCDFLGAHFCEPRMIDKYIHYPQKYESALKEYFDAIFSPFKVYVQKGLEKIENLNINIACTSHGPVLTKGERLEYALNNYREWCAHKLNTTKTIPIFYTSAYGNTEKAAEIIKDTILSVITNADVTLYNIIEHDLATLSEKLNSSDAFLIGTPTINRDAVPPTWQLLSHIDAINIQKKPCAVFGSYGWSGEGVPAVCQRLKTLKLSVFEDGMKFIFVPGDDDTKAIKSFAKAFAKSL